MEFDPKAGIASKLAQAVAATQAALRRKAAQGKADQGRAGQGRADQGSSAPQPGSLPMLAGLPKMPALVRDLLGGLAGGSLPGGRPGMAGTPSQPAAATAPDGARFLTLSYGNQAGSRPYKLFVPSGYRGQPVPLVVMLHGCTQSPDDFAAGTGMNTLAEAQTCLVAYPGQTAAAHNQRCWNWYNAQDQRRDAGEPSIIAGITRQVMAEYAVDPRRVYLAGLSAGGAEAAVVGAAYPDLYAAIGVHSGLACGAATNLSAALSAMRQGAAGPALAPRGGRVVPAIVFHGDRDTTVHPSNGDAVVAQLTPAGPLRTRAEDGQVPGGRAYRRTLHEAADGSVAMEQWLVHGAGHAWSGGSSAGSYTDPRGPDASAAMLRFFLAHPHPAPAG